MNSPDRTTPPHIQTISSFSLTKPLHFETKNKVNAWLFENDNLKLIHFSLRVRAGSLFEPYKMVARCTWSQLQESAANYSADEVEDFLDYYGSSFNVFVNMEYVTLSFIVPERNCGKVVPFIFDFLLYPQFSKKNLNRFKQKKIKDLKYEQLRMSYRSGQLLYHALLNNEIPEGNILSTEDIESLSVDQLSDYHAKSFCAENITFFVAGSLSNENLSLLIDLLEKIPSKELLSLPRLFSDNNPAGKIVYENHEGAVQSSIRLCRRFIDYHDRDRRDFTVLSTLFGGYFGSRLMQNIRELKGYTYGIYSMITYFGNASIFYVDADVVAEKTEDAVEQCKIEMNRLRDKHVDKDELTLVKNYMMGSLLRKLDGTVDVMRSFFLWQSCGLDEREADRMIDTIKTISPERLRELAEKYLIPEDFTTIIVGKMR